MIEGGGRKFCQNLVVTSPLVWPNFCCKLSHILQGLPLSSRTITWPILFFRSCVDLCKLLQKTASILENKVLWKLKLSKNDNNKKKIGMFRIIFDIKNWLWKSKFCNFWQWLLNWTQDLKLFYRAVFFCLELKMKAL